MKRKPKGQKARNLFLRGGTIYYERLLRGRRVRFSCQTDDWDKAAAVREAYEAEHERHPTLEKVARGMVPTLRAFTPRYLREDTDRLAVTTLRNLRGYLKPKDEGGCFLHYFEGKRLDEIPPEMLSQWWAKEITQRVVRKRKQSDGTMKETEGPKRSTQTGRHYINTLAAIYSYARELGYDVESPVPRFREMLVGGAVFTPLRRVYLAAANRVPEDDRATRATYVHRSVPEYVPFSPQLIRHQVSTDVRVADCARKSSRKTKCRIAGMP